MYCLCWLLNGLGDKNILWGVREYGDKEKGGRQAEGALSIEGFPQDKVSNTCWYQVKLVVSKEEKNG